MQKNPKLNKSSIFDKAFEFTTKNLLILSVAAGAVLVIVVLFTVMGTVNASNMQKAVKIYDQSVNNLNNISYITNNDDRVKFYQEQINNLNALANVYPKTIAAQRARLLLGKVFFDDTVRGGSQDSINTAVSYYTAVIQNATSDYYRSLGLIGRGQCYELKNDYQKAIDDYQTVYSRYPKEGFSSTVLMGIARNKEMLGDVDSAVKLYEQVTKDFPKSDWARLAQGKIYYFNDPEARKNAAKAPVITNTQPQLQSLPSVLQK